MTSTNTISIRRRKRDADDGNGSEVDVVNEDNPASNEGAGQTSPGGAILQNLTKEVSSSARASSDTQLGF